MSRTVSSSRKSGVNDKGELDLTDVPEDYLKAFSGIFDQSTLTKFQQSTVDKVKKLPDIRRGVGLKASEERRGKSFSRVPTKVAMTSPDKGFVGHMKSPSKMTMAETSRLGKQSLI